MVKKEWIEKGFVDDPVDAKSHSVTRCCITKESDAENKSNTFGNKNTVSYGLYRMHGFISATDAAKTGFSEEDKALLFEAIINAFENDHAAARGEMNPRALIVFKHESPLGNARAGQYSKEDVVLEPSFFSEVLGIQGRLDFLCQKGRDVTIIEQKSGKGEFVPFKSPDSNPDIPVIRESHKVQLILYRALFNYEFGKYAEELKHIMLLYSKYSAGLVLLANDQTLLLRAIRMRNLIAWSEIFYAKEGLDILTTLTPDKLNLKQISGRLWENYLKPQLSALLAPIYSATKLERSYYLRFLRFLENEQLLSKVGNKQKENSGFASENREGKQAADNGDGTK